MTEAIPVTRKTLADVRGIIPDEVIAKWIENGEVIEVDKHD